MAMEPVDVTHFATPDEFRSWLEKNHDSCAALWVGYWKKATRKPSVTWEETVDVALCFGWIDGIRKRIDDEAYTIRFTPRRAGSVWSLRNCERYVALEKAGLIHPSGEAEWAKRTGEKTGVYSFEQEKKRLKERKTTELGDSWMKRLRDAPDLLEAWNRRPPSWRRQSAHFVMSAKKEETRERRFGKVVDDLRENG